ncbi:MAG: undecaprenyl/decaprenyl-phosphate alpha-N-acetylglucosaminyl 1-phosphate transferase, partial [Prevotella sp.]|nr:undecaprenyl/decaprenyl-phosphate alpha-N-acetylglucosaminyl 1-phosphate transferase [Prevotella sp.]
MFGLPWNLWLFGIVVPFFVAMMLVFAAHPLIIRIARKMQVLDMPDEARKIQDYPVPVMGGVAVIWGIIVGAGITSMFFNSYA